MPTPFDAWRETPDRTRLRRVLEDSEDRVYNICFQVLRRREDAEDAAQEALLKIARGIDRIHDAPHFERWVTRVALHAALDLRRRLRTRLLHETQVIPMAAAPSDDERDALFAALASLEEEERHLVMRHYFDRATLQRLADEQGCAIVTIWKRIEQARTRLREALTTAGFAVAIPRLDVFLETSVPAAAPSTLVPAAALDLVRWGGLAMAAKSAGTGPLVIGGLLLLILGGAGGWVLNRPGPEPASASSLPEALASLHAARRDLEAWKGKAGPIPGTAETGSPAPAAGAPAIERIPPGPLLERLRRYRDMRNRLAEEAKAVDRLSPEARKAFRQRRLESLLQAENDLHLDVMKNPADFFQFVRGESDPNHLQGLLAILCPGQPMDDGGYSIDPTPFLDYPPALRSGLQALLLDGTAGQKAAALKAVELMGPLPEDLGARVSILTSDPDDRLRMAALSVLDSVHDNVLPDAFVPALRELLGRTNDRDVLNDGYQILGRAASPEVQDALLERFAVETDPGHVKGLLAALRNSLDRLSQERRTRLGEAMVLAGSRNQDPGLYRSILHGAMALAGEDRRRTFEGLASHAPNAELKAATDRILGLLRAGEERTDRLRGALKP